MKLKASPGDTTAKEEGEGDGQFQIRFIFTNVLTCYAS
jgi:hypothetical protein